MNAIKRYFTTSFRRRLIIRILLIVTIIFGSVGYIINLLIKNAIVLEAQRGAKSVMDMTNHRIDNLLNSVEVAIENNIPAINKTISRPDIMEEIAKRIVKVNPMISGSAVAFMPNYYKGDKILYCPYSYEDSTGIHSKQLATKEYNYIEKKWFKDAIKVKEGRWTEPYYDEGGGNMVMTTYTHPVFDNDSNIVAVLTADMSLDELSMLIANIKYYDKAFSFAITHEGTYIVHPDTTKILKEKIFDNPRLKNDTTFNSLVKSMVAGETGTKILNVNNEKLHVFYSPVKRMNWSIGIVCPEKSFLIMALTSGFLVVFFLIVGLLLIIYLCSKQVKKMLRPLERFTESADEIAKGNLKAPLPQVKSKDEMYRLRNSFQYMQESLEDYIKELKTVNEEKGRIEGELRVAKNIQQAMIPKVYPPFPERDDVEIYGQLTPAKEIGGDLFDFFIRDEKLFFCIGDVSGKGVPASLVMAVTRSLFRNIAAHESQPQRIISLINESTTDANETLMFVTLFIGVLDLPTGRFRYCNAGHCAPLLLGENTSILPVKPNIPIGILKGYKYMIEETEIPYNTIIFLYTDGLTEAEDRNQKLFGEERMIRIAQEFCKNGELTPTSLIKKMTGVINDFAKDTEQSDDLTMLALRYCKVECPNTFSRKLVLPNDVSTIPQLNEFVDEVCENAEFDMPTTMSMNLAMEEAVVNVMNYAYPKGMLGNVNIEAQINEKRLKFVISDHGTPFDPTEKEDADVTLSVEERPIGGLGIYLVRQIMDSVNYERLDGMNVLTLRKFLKTQNNEQ